jgi:hypothetical protein
MIEIGENEKMWYIGEEAGALPTYPPKGCLFIKKTIKQLHTIKKWNTFPAPTPCPRVGPGVPGS